MSPPRTHVLVVEDDADCRDAIVDFLELSGYAATSASDGVEALALLRSRALPDALLVDLRMPRMDGEQLIAALALEPRLRLVPVIAVSGSVERPCPPGAAALVHKPFDPPALLDALAFVLSEARVVAVAR